jgi:hypothetical protein
MRKNKDLVIFRTTQEESCEVLTQGILSEEEWHPGKSLDRILEDSWESRYNQEASILTQIITEK